MWKILQDHKNQQNGWKLWTLAPSNRFLSPPYWLVYYWAHRKPLTSKSWFLYSQVHIQEGSIIYLLSLIRADLKKKKKPTVASLLCSDMEDMGSISSLWVWNGLVTFFDHQMWSVEGLCQPALGPALKKLCWALLPTRWGYFLCVPVLSHQLGYTLVREQEPFLSVHPQSPVGACELPGHPWQAQWLRVCLAIQGTWVPPLVRELRTRVRSCWALVCRAQGLQLESRAARQKIPRITTEAQLRLEAAEK